ncbi:uncharacterized protein MONBRDRAFT_24028 [Monosiga brevicollis MX1]|uniref:Uncharacterized protein n=1 Tax=Monosiga brevicollis TaxID=81824 RepID=A9UUH6_MONBE|nr:uncharacterized protein MONBRDRAFT_24028 [Monosiga brevicollis MX1]EDQ90904.1 predicted protein [Monosiga brevicollis MX1]|eukprot:XP_001744201.1 hypothetical protein [Monosiga brevicollis MX1]
MKIRRSGSDDAGVDVMCLERAGTALAGVEGLRERLKAEEMRHAETKKELKLLKQEISQQKDRICKLEDTVERLQGTIDGLKQEMADMKKTHSEEMADMKKTHSEEMADMKKTYSEDMADMKKAHSEDMADMKKAHSEDMADMKKAHSEEMADMKKTYSEDMADMKKAHSEEMADMKKAHSEDMADMKKTHSEEMDEMKRDLYLKLDEQQRAREQDKRIHQSAREKDRARFVAGQVAHVFINRLGCKFLGDAAWKKQRRHVSNLDELLEMMAENAAPLEQLLKDNFGDLDTEEICDVIYEVKAMRNPCAHPVCLDPEHTDNQCECNPDPQTLKAAVLKAVQSRQKRIMSLMVDVNDKLARERHDVRQLEVL